MKTLISCPNCESMGRRKILGEVKDGMFIVMRFHNGFTKIRGEFEVLCDICNEPVYFRTDPDLIGTEERREYAGTITRIGLTRIFRGSLSQTVGEFGTPGSAVA